MRAVNLIPTEQRSGGSVGARSGGAAFAVLGLLAGLVVLAFLYGSARRDYTSRRAEVAALTARAQEVREQTTRLASYTSFVEMREARMKSIAQLVGSRFDWAGAMGELSRVLPADVSLGSIQAVVGSTTGSAGSPAAAAPAAGSSAAGAASAAAPVSSSTPPGAVPAFTLAGCAVAQTAVAQTLVRLRLVSGVSNVTLLSSTKSSGGGSGNGSCPDGDPAFSAQVSFQPLPAPPSANIAAIEAAAAPSSGSKHPVSDRSKGAHR